MFLFKNFGLQQLQARSTIYTRIVNGMNFLKALDVLQGPTSMLSASMPPTGSHDPTCGVWQVHDLIRSNFSGTAQHWQHVPSCSISWNLISAHRPSRTYKNTCHMLTNFNVSIITRLQLGKQYDGTLRYPQTR